MQSYICNQTQGILINIHAITSLLRFYTKADTYYRVHSPFVFQFIQAILEDNRQYYLFDKIKALREELNKNQTKIAVKDLGAGSKKSDKSNRTIQSIAK